MEQMSDEEFIDFVVMRRMELRYSQWNSIRRSKTKKEHDKIEKAYEAAIFADDIGAKYHVAFTTPLNSFLRCIHKF